MVQGLSRPWRRSFWGRGTASLCALIAMALWVLTAFPQGTSAHSPGATGYAPPRATDPPGPVGYAEIWRQASFEMDRLLKAWPLKMGGLRDDVLVLGRNYETREVRLLRLRWQEGRMEVVWRSPNYFQWASPVAMALGDFRGLGLKEVVVITNTETLLLAPAGDGFEEVWRAPNPLGQTWEALAVPAPGGRKYRLGLVRLASVESLLPVKDVVWFTWEEQGWRVAGSGPRLVSVRSMAPFFLEGWDHHGLVVDRGWGTQPGRIEVWMPWAGGWHRLSSQALRPAAVFALAGGWSRQDAPGAVVIGDHRGRVGIYQWIEGGLRPLGEASPVGWGLVDVALADLTGDGVDEIVVLGNPNRVHLLAPSTWQAAGARP